MRTGLAGATLEPDMFLHRHRRPRGPAPNDAGAGAGRAVFDAAALDRLRELDPDDSRGFVQQVLRTYAASLRRHLARLAPLPGSLTDPKVAAEVAHLLKSSSASTGALAFAACCARLERAARSEDEGDFLPALAAVRDEGDRVLAALDAMLPA